VNCICPGTTDTPLTHNALKEFGNYEENLSTLTKMNAALQRLIKPEEIANFALFLASDESSAMTGGAYVVDAGLTAI
jgi:NAD(P)-dependent dehydrogenase (short-subunit alcohol dehydrogenase family)